MKMFFLKCFKISGELWLLGYCVFFKGLYKLYQTGWEKHRWWCRWRISGVTCSWSVSLQGGSGNLTRVWYPVQVQGRLLLQCNHDSPDQILHHKLLGFAFLVNLNRLHVAMKLKSEIRIFFCNFPPPFFPVFTFLLWSRAFMPRVLGLKTRVWPQRYWLTMDWNESGLVLLLPLRYWFRGQGAWCK